mmetsp:Transcript_121898/g.351988  ORF Transcript_121898/g.351988 Transcript_121898/m.351988 type:complete len:418 (+) Transcript_121898:83-1336(+)
MAPAGPAASWTPLSEGAELLAEEGLADDEEQHLACDRSTSSRERARGLSLVLAVGLAAIVGAAAIWSSWHRARGGDAAEALQEYDSRANGGWIVASYKDVTGRDPPSSSDASADDADFTIVDDAGSAVVDDKEACSEATPGTSCYENVTWAKTQAIFEHPEWYPGLSMWSSRDKFQRHFHETYPAAQCSRPCPSNEEDTVCDFEFNGAPSTLCFCQLAKNRGCSDMPCACQEGCGDSKWSSPGTVTFKNMHSAWGCSVNTALLTIPRSYITDISYLKTWCPTKMEALLTEMLLAGFIAYTDQFGLGTVEQCIHSAKIVTVKWLHLHTFCPGGHIDGMPSNWDTAWCGQMSRHADAPALAKQAVAWAVSLFGPVPAEPPRTCARMGCGAPAPVGHCSCDPSCVRAGRCCDDFGLTCGA